MKMSANRETTENFEIWKLKWKKKMFYYLTIECDERVAYACNRTRAIPNEHILQQ